MSIEILVGLIGLIGGLVGNFISGTQSLISMSSFLALGIPPHMALSVYHFGGLGFSMGSFYNYSKSKKIFWKYVLPTTLISVVAVAIGTKIVLGLDQEILEKIMGIFILFLIPLTLKKKHLGVERREVSKVKEYLGYSIYFIGKIWYGIFPMGFGFIISYVYFYFWGMTILDMRGTSRIPGIVTSIVAGAVLILSGVVNWKLGIIFFITSFIGSHIGSHYSIKTGDKVLQYLLMAAILLLSIKTIFF